MNSRLQSFFGKNRTIYPGKAPARLDVMGGISDYSGSLVLQMPLDLYTEVFIAKRNDQVINIRSGSLKCELDCSALLQQRGGIVDHKGWKRYALEDWALYVLGCVFILLDKKPFAFHGLDILIESKVPIGKGISSSAALEVATLHALYKVFNLSIEKEELALMAQTAENKVANAPCGIMDQMAVHLGRKDALLPIICQPNQLKPSIPIPPGLSFSGLDTGVKHAVSGTAYSKVRTAAFMGLSIILQSLGVDQKDMLAFKENNMPSLPYGGYLANIPVNFFEKKISNLLPEKISGKDFISQYGRTTDLLSRIKETEIYPVFNCTKHPIFENDRIHKFKNLLTQKVPDKEMLGQLMLQSHQGYLDCGLSCDEADYIVELVKELIEKQVVFGARITGGGSGGTVCILSEELAAVYDIQAKYKDRYAHQTTVFSGSSDGAYFLN